MTSTREALRFCNSFNRLPTLISIWFGQYGDIEASEWLRLLGEEWSVCDNIGEFADDTRGVSLWDTPLGDVLTGGLDGSAMMSAAEQDAFAALPDKVEVWRGCYANNKWGLSWSLDRATAEGFPALHRYRGEGRPLLVRAMADKSKIAALKLDREEIEIITHRPRHISTSKIKIE